MGGKENARQPWIDAIDFKKISCRDRYGFETWFTVRELVDEGKMASIPQKNGVYLVLFPENSRPGFNGGDERTFELNDETPKDARILEKEQWVEGTRVLYIGKAGVLNGRGSSNLRKRLREYMKWYQKKYNKHHGGRDIWQLNDPGDLLVTWRVTEDVDPEKCEKDLLDKFREEFKKYPFANHRR